MNRRNLIARALALLGVSAAAAVPAMAEFGRAAADTDPGFGRDPRGALVWLHVDGWSWTYAEQHIIPDDENFWANMHHWCSTCASAPDAVVGMDLRTYDILVRHNWVGRAGDHRLLAGKPIRVVHLALDSRIDPNLERAVAQGREHYGDFSWSL